MGLAVQVGDAACGLGSRVQRLGFRVVLCWVFNMLAVQEDIIFRFRNLTPREGHKKLKPRLVSLWGGVQYCSW